MTYQECADLLHVPLSSIQMWVQIGRILPCNGDDIPSTATLQWRNSIIPLNDVANPRWFLLLAALSKQEMETKRKHEALNLLDDI